MDSQPGPSSSSGLALLKKKPKYENQLKRTTPFVSLCADQTGKKMSIDTIIANLYVKIPESEVSVNSILCDVAPKLDCPVEDLTILDSTLVPLPDEDRGKLLISYFNGLDTILTYCRHRVLACAK